MRRYDPPMEHLTAPPGWVGKMVAFLFRPRLLVSSDSVFISPPHTVPHWSGRTRQGTVRVNAWVLNFGRQTARECNVFLDQVYKNGALVYDGHSPLAWTGESDEARFAFRSLRPGKENGIQFDICWGLLQRQGLEIMDKRNSQFGETADYRLEIRAEAAWPASAAKIRIDVAYDREQETFLVTGVHAPNRWLRLW